MSFDSAPITVKDAANADKSMIAFNDGANNAFANALLKADGTLMNPATAENQATTNTSLGAPADSAASSDTGTFSLIALLKRGLQSLTTIGTNTTGLATAANQSTGNTSLSTIATNTTGAATAANQSTANSKLDTVIANTGAGGKSIFTTPTVTAGAYSTGQVVGGKISLANAVRSSGGAGIIQAVSVAKRTNLTAPFDVIFFNADPTNSTFTDNSALAVNVADLDKIVGVVQCTNLISLGTPQLLQGLNAGIPFNLASGTTLFAVMVIRGAETYFSTNAVTLAVDLLQS